MANKKQEEIKPKRPPKEGEKRLIVRMPDAVHDKLSRVADAERRSLNAMIIYMIEQYKKKP